MTILFDNGVPHPLRHKLSGHIVTTTQELGWMRLGDGELLRRAVTAYEVLVTTDQNIPFQQNLGGCQLAILILTEHNWQKLRDDFRFLVGVIAAVNALKPGDLVCFPEKV